MLTNTMALEGRYQIKELLGKGGFGTVYKAWDQQLDRDVAIKFIDNTNPGILSEARALAKINCPNLISVFDIIQCDTQTGIVMELVDSPDPLTLESILNLEPARFFSFFSQLLLAIEAVHKAGLLHLDIKPDNILITRDGEVKLTDFGIAQYIESLDDKATQPSASYGSWFCVSAEQLEQKALSTATDIFALGVLLHQYLYRQHPYLVEGNQQLSMKQITSGRINQVRQPPRLHQPELIDLCQLMLQRNPKKRPVMQQIIATVRQAMERQSSPAMTTQAMPTSKSTLRQKVVKNKPLLYTLTSIVLITSIITLYLLIPPKIKTTLVVPTLKPDIQAEAKHIDNNLLTSVIIEDELVEAVIGDPTRKLVSKKEWQGSRNWAEVAKRLDVDEIIFSEVNCQALVCNVSLGIYNKDKDQILGDMRLDIPHDHLTEFKEALHQSLIRFLELDAVFSERDRDISHSDLKSYIQYKSQFESLSVGDGSLEHLLEIKQRNPSYQGAYRLIGELYLQYYKQYQDPQWLKLAQASIAELKESFPMSTGIYALEFNIVLAAHDFAKAQDVLNKLKNNSGLDITGHTLAQAMIYFNQGKKEKGYKLVKSLKSPRLIEQYFHAKAYMEHDLKDNVNLKQTAKNWLSKFPQNLTASFFLGDAHLHSGNLEETISLYTKIPSGSQTFNSLSNLALAELFSTNYAKAERYFQQAKELSPGLPVTWLSIGETYLAQNMQEKAFPYFEKTIELSKQAENDWQNYAFEALANAHLGRKEKASLALQLSAEASQNDPEYYLLSAYTYAVLGNREAAIFQAKKARENGYLEHWFNLPWSQFIKDELERPRR